jgi:aminopeptidase N
MAYPTQDSEKYGDGRALRLVTTDDFVNLVNRETGKDLSWFFEVYIRQAKLPVLKSTTVGNTLNLEWDAPAGLPFPMPIDVILNGKTVRVPMTGGKGSVPFTGTPPVVDPLGWVLR